MTRTHIFLSLAIGTKIIIQMSIGSYENQAVKQNKIILKTVKTKNKLIKKNTKPITAKLKL